MTDKEKLDKLVAEIERRIESIDRNMPFGLNINADFIKQELERLLLFIDSMQEECNITGIKSKEATGKLKECIDTITDESLAKARKQLQEEPKKCMYTKDNYTDEDRKVLCDGCEEKCAYAIAGVISTNAQIKKESVSEEQVKKSLIVKHEDKTCKENGNFLTQELVSEDLEEAAKHYLYSNILYDDVYVGNPTDKDCIEMFKAGANRQKQKDANLIFNAKEDGYRLGLATMKQLMMAKAVDGLVVCNNLTHGYKDILMKIPSYLNVDDEVKVIVIKE